MKAPKCEECIVQDQRRFCRSCPRKMLRGTSPNWAMYARVRKFILSEEGPSRGKEECLKRLHQKLDDAQALFSVYSRINLSGMYLLIDSTGIAMNPKGLNAEPMLLRTLDDVRAWMKIRESEGMDVVEWLIFRK